VGEVVVEGMQGVLVELQLVAQDQQLHQQHLIAFQ
jgi:hypothetical protein